MGFRGRFWVSVLLSVLMVGQLSSIAEGAEEAHLAEAVTSDSPGEFGDILVDSIDAFEPGEGRAMIEPGMVNEETFVYQDIGTNPPRLIGVSRPVPEDHPSGAIVRPIVETRSSPHPGPDKPPAPSPEEGEKGEDDGEAASPLPSPPPSPSEATDSSTPEGSSSPDEAEGSESVCQGVVCVPQECIDYPFTGDLMACVNALGGVDAVCSSYDSCRAFLIETLCPVSAIFCNIPPSTSQVVAQVFFDDTLGLPTPYAPGCGLAGFYARSATGQRVPDRPYTATATTLATLSAPQIYEGTLDANGYAVLPYCPPPGVMINPVEVTFTATVDGVSGVAVRSWEDSGNWVDNWNEPIPEYGTPDRTDIWDLLPHPNPPPVGPPVFGDLQELHSQVEDMMPIGEIDPWTVDNVGLGGDKKCTITAAAPRLGDGDGITLRAHSDYECDKKRHVIVTIWIQWRAAKTWENIEDSGNTVGYNAKEHRTRTHGDCRPITNRYRTVAWLTPAQDRTNFLDTDRSSVEEISCRPNE